jgi:hypothetical protein
MNKMMKVKNMGDGADNEEPQQLSRREREAIDAARRKAEYDRLHAEGTFSFSNPKHETDLRTSLLLLFALFSIFVSPQVKPTRLSQI